MFLIWSLGCGDHLAWTNIKCLLSESFTEPCQWFTRYFMIKITNKGLKHYLPSPSVVQHWELLHIYKYERSEKMRNLDVKQRLQTWIIRRGPLSVLLLAVSSPRSSFDCWVGICANKSTASAEDFDVTTFLSHKKQLYCCSFSPARLCHLFSLLSLI